MRRKKMKTEKVMTEEVYHLSDEGFPGITVHIVDNNKITIYNKYNKLDFTFLDCEPSIVARIGTMFVEATKLIKEVVK